MASNIIFMGTPDFAIPSLQEMCQAGFTPDLVVTQPDRPQGRGLKYQAPPIKVCAEQLGLPVYQPEKISTETQEIFNKYKPELIVVVAYAAKIPPWLLALPGHGCINLHPSLLPCYRGAAPLQWALINGETETGLTIFYLNEKWDAGDIIKQEPLAIFADEDYPQLAARASKQGAQLLVRAIREILAQKATRSPQNHALATYAHLLKADAGRIDFQRPAQAIVNLIRGVTPRPGAFAFLNGKRIKILKAEAIARQTDDAPGTVVWVDHQNFEIACQPGRLRPLIVQEEGKRPQPAADFINGHHLTRGQVLI